ncbi:MAG: hypothetical protein LWX00_04585 [Spirochaetia bacterium]|nr:hypothetical protein [Spirochaetia bacterium]
MIYWNRDLAARLKCPEKEKQQLPIFIKKLMVYVEKIHEIGVPATIPNVERPLFPYFYQGLSLIMDNLSTEAIEEIMAVYLSVSQESGFQFLKQCIETEVVLSLASGDTPEFTFRKIVPYAGIDQADWLIQSAANMGTA